MRTVNARMEDLHKRAPAPAFNVRAYDHLSNADLVKIMLAGVYLSAGDAAELRQEAEVILLRLYPHHAGLSAFLADLGDPEVADPEAGT